MLAERRDPLFDQGAHGASSPPPVGVGPQPPLAAPAFTRFIAGVQIFGTVLAIPLGLASGYSIYRANFSPEAKCGTLRANIISLLDKNADATTLRLLVRRDVATFEQSCAAVDPDAVAAFKTLLVKPKAVAAAKAAKPTTVAKREDRPTQVERVSRREAARVEPEKRVEAARTSAIEEAKRARHKADANWLAAVRRALVERAPVTRAQAAEAPMPLAPPAAPPSAAAPPLPPPAAVAAEPVSRHDENHPVPPGLIPNAGTASSQ